MTQNTEQKVRTRDEQVDDLFLELSKGSVILGRATVAEAHIAEAEARGAAEQRRKDAEGCIPVHQYFMGGFWNDCSPEMFANQSHRRVLYTHPANVAALEARVRELEGVLGPLLSACEEEMTGPSTDECSDEESVATGMAGDGTATESPITFGMLRTARAALKREGGV